MVLHTSITNAKNSEDAQNYQMQFSFFVKRKRIIICVVSDFDRRTWRFLGVVRCGNDIGQGIFLKRSSLGEVAIAAFLFEELCKVWLAVQYSIQRSIRRRRKIAPSVCTFEAILVVEFTLHSHLQFQYSLQYQIINNFSYNPSSNFD